MCMPCVINWVLGYGSRKEFAASKFVVVDVCGGCFSLQLCHQDSFCLRSDVLLRHAALTAQLVCTCVCEGIYLVSLWVVIP